MDSLFANHYDGPQAERTLSVTEVAMQDQTKASNREHFIRTNTNPMPDWEKAGAGFERQGDGLFFVDGEYIKVHKIRYTGSTGTNNRFKL